MNYKVATIKKLINQGLTQDFLKKSFVGIILAYLLLFGLETILPGMIMDIFNINYLLFAILTILFVFLSAKKNREKTTKKRSKKFSWFISLGFVFLSGVFVVALYRVSLVESFFYLFLGLLIVRLIWTNME